MSAEIVFNSGYIAGAGENISHSASEIGSSAYIFIIIIGIFLGIVYAISWSDTGEADLSKQTRVKNLLWVCGPAIVLIFGDVSKFTSLNMSGQDKLTMLSCYMLSVLVSFISVSILIVVSIKKIVSGKIRDKARGKSIYYQFIIEYIRNGYGRVEGFIGTLDQLERKSTYEIVGEYGDLLYVIMSKTNEVSGADEQNKTRMIHAILSSISSVTILFSSGSQDIKIKTNYMLRLKNTENLKPQDVMFCDRDLHEYGGFLELKYYDDNSSPKIILPFESKDSQDWDKKTLPGAPECMLTRHYALLSCGSEAAASKIKFGASVNNEIKEKIKIHFSDCPYQSLLCIPIISKDDEVVGVLNIESNLGEIVEKGEGVVQDIVMALEPFCSMLAQVCC
ncbi:MAG: hypothetical protein ABF802_10685 [Acetobacter orientalis]|uniref:hypothetical protein n=1 Tax=Acetobacter orientalis TaxID=146474 RepID=UPI0039E98348